MWYDLIDNTYFLKTLFIEVPDLNNVTVHKINFCEQGDRILISFQIPGFVDYAPNKWKLSGANAAVVDLELFSIRNASLKTCDNTYKANISLEKFRDDLIKLKMDGTIQLEITAEYAMVQEIRGIYIQT